MARTWYKSEEYIGSGWATEETRSPHAPASFRYVELVHAATRLADSTIPTLSELLKAANQGDKAAQSLIFGYWLQYWHWEGKQGAMPDTDFVVEIGRPRFSQGLPQWLKDRAAATEAAARAALK